MKETLIFEFLRWLPFGDDEPEFFNTTEEAVDMVKRVFPVLPQVNETFEDLSSDEGVSQMAFYGIGQVLLEKCGKEDDDSAYQVDLTPLAKLEVRPGHQAYGANAVFDGDGKLGRIYVSALDKTVHLGEEEWEHAKWVSFANKLHFFF